MMENKSIMKEALILLHGFKRNNIDDFDEIIDEFNDESKQIFRFSYFDNYDKNSLKNSSVKKLVNSFAKEINELKFDKITIIAYSTGAITSSLLFDKLDNKDNIKIYGLVPPIKLYLVKWISRAKNLYFKNKKIKKKLGKERYESLYKKMEKNNVKEKHPIKLFIFINNFRVFHRRKLLKMDNVEYLISNTDDYIYVEKIIKMFDKRNIKYDVKTFDHGKILMGEKQIFIDWISVKDKSLIKERDS